MQIDGTPISTVPTQIEDEDFKIVFTPAQDENGSPYATFTVVARDDKTGVSAPAVVTVDVTPINDAPIATVSSCGSF